MRLLVYIFILFTFSLASPLSSIDKINILPTCKYLVESSNYKQINQIKIMPEDKWLTSKKKSLSFGYNQNKKVWLKCTFANQSNLEITKVLENENSHIAYVSFC